MNSPPPVTTSPLLSWDHKNLVQGLQTSAGEYQYFFLSDILYHCVSLLLNLFTSILLWPFSSLLIFNPHQHSCPHSIPEHPPHPGAVSQTSPTSSSSAPVAGYCTYWGNYLRCQGCHHYRYYSQESQQFKLARF